MLSSLELFHHNILELVVVYLTQPIHTKWQMPSGHNLPKPNKQIQPINPTQTNNLMVLDFDINKFIQDTNIYINKQKQFLENNTILKKPAFKSVLIHPSNKQTSDINKQNIQRTNSQYQELGRKMTIQKSQTTKLMFETDPNLWHTYHNSRDFSFKGYDDQDQIPLNKIISYLETKKHYKLKILDLGCGRNLISNHFKSNNNFTIIGYDYVEFNGSSKVDISNLPDQNQSVKICIYSQSLMGSNWKDYLLEGKRVLEYNGEMIISESTDRYDVIKNYLKELKMIIIKDEHNETNRWFYIYAIKQ